MKKTGKVVSLSCIAAIAAATIAINAIAISNSALLNQWASITKVYASDEEKGELMDQGKDLAKQIEAEGAVLAENDGVLPLSKTEDTKVNVFGWSSTQWIYSGSGSGRTNGENEETDLITALNDYGVQTNTELTDMYTSFLDSRPYDNNSQGTLNSTDQEFNVLYEPSIDNQNLYTDSLLSDAKSFSDAAIVVLGRVTGESTDAPKEQYYSNTKGGLNHQTDSSRTYLDISQDEEDLLNYVSENYDKTIVVVNSTSQLNLDFLKTILNVDACLCVGTTGDVGAEVIPELLYGDISPSGRFTDTYVYDFKSNPGYYDAADIDGQWGRYKNGSGLYPDDGTTQGNIGQSGVPYPGVSYTDYSEGIYVGYKWYETADAEGYFDDVSNEYGTGYDGIVEFPFGYGLSYSTFDQEITGLSKVSGASVTDEETISVTVTVKNTGKVKAADAVQLYLTAPYTTGGIEKSYVNLVGYGKTAELEPGASEDVKIDLDVSDWASYDDYDKNGNGFKGYELEAGDYQVKLMKNAHELYSSNSYVTYHVDKDIEIAADPVSGNPVHNEFDAENSSDGIAIDGNNTDQDITYLSRADFKGTFASKPSANRTMSAELKAQNIYTSKMAEEAIDESDEPVTFDEDNGLTITNSDGTVNDLGLELGSDFNDAKWDDLLDEISKADMERYTLHGYVHTEAISSIGLPETKEADGPSQVGSFNLPKYGNGYPEPTVLAQTFNKDLAYSYGKQLGKEANYCGYQGWYAPAVNLHRSPFGGRNYEYYSEDPLLTGLTGAYVVRGSLNVGTFVYLKHLIVYEQETYRDGMYTWMTEQSLREEYLKPFKIAIDTGGLTGIMTSYNRLGATWASGNESLIKGVLYDEWGYKGSILTDYSDHQEYMNMDQAIRAGTTLWMDGYSNNGTYKYETTSNTFDQALRNATKRNIYTYLNAAYELDYTNKNGDEQFESVHSSSTPYWPYVLGGFDALIAAGLGTWIYFALRTKKVRKPKEKGYEKK